MRGPIDPETGQRDYRLAERAQSSEEKETASGASERQEGFGQGKSRRFRTGPPALDTLGQLEGKENLPWKREPGGSFDTPSFTS